MEGVYHICPNMTPDELEVGREIIQACENSSCRRFVYHSVLHPQVVEMPHHWQKMQVEQLLFKSSLDYSILQPTAYFQNIAGYRDAILRGTYPMPYASSARISLVDVRDVASACVKVFLDPSTRYGIYELAGTLPMSQTEVAKILSNHVGYPVNSVEVSKSEWEANAKNGNMSDYARNTLLSMFNYYDIYGLSGSPLALTFLLGRKPITIEKYLLDEF
jgi:uncharacterized protein YbjT (DUF2867 family)